MEKYSPIFGGDESLYTCTKAEIDFALNSRKSIDRNHGQGFNKNFVQSVNADVGFYFHTAEDALFGEERVFLRFFENLEKLGVHGMFAVPTGYVYSKNNSESIELTEFSPPLVAKIPASLDGLIAARGSMIAIYSQQYLMFTDCLHYAAMDFNGHYSMIMGPRPLVENALGMAVEDSWNEVRLGIHLSLSY